MSEAKHRLDYQPLFGKWAHIPPPKHERAAEIEPKLSINFHNFVIWLVFVAEWYSTHSDWLFLKGIDLLKCPVGSILWAYKTKSKSHIVYRLLTSNFQSLRENLKPLLCLADFAVTLPVWQGLVWDFPVKTSLIWLILM